MALVSVSFKARVRVNFRK